MMFGKELYLPDTLISGAPIKVKAKKSVRQGTSANLDLAFERLRDQQQNIRSHHTQEPLSYEKNNLVWLKSKKCRKEKTGKLQPKFVGPFEILEVFANHTYTI